MSTITKTWTEDKIRSIIRKLDEKTGLNGTALPIAFNSYGWFLGHYRYVEPKAFGFNRKFFNDSTTGEAEVIDVIRHEYAHYYVDVAHLERYIGHSRRETSHGDDWKWACKMVGADPTRCHNNSDSISKKWSLTDAIAAYNADDVVEFDVLAYLNKWHQAPVDSETASRLSPVSKNATLMPTMKSAMRSSIPREDSESLRMPSPTTTGRRKSMSASRTRAMVCLTLMTSAKSSTGWLSLIRRSVGEQTLWSRKDEIYSHISTTEIKKELKKWRFPKRSRIQGQKANTNPPKY